MVSFMKKIILCCTCLFWFSCLWANDTAGELLPTGEIQFEKQADIVLKNEALVLSEKVAVDYLFENTADRDITTHVFFPLPPTSPLVPYFSQGHNFRFKVWVDGKEIAYQTHRRITVDGKDVTRYFDRMGLDTYDKVISLDGSDVEGTTKKLQQIVQPLPEEIKQEMRQLGILEKSCSDWEDTTDICTHFSEEEQLTLANYRQEVSFYWTQTFPAHATVHIYHEYIPSFLEQSVGYPYASNIPFEYKEGNDIFWKAAAYIVTTANNWQQPIGAFHLLVLGTKGAAVSTFDEGKTADTIVADGNYLMIEKRDFVPSREILFEIASDPHFPHLTATLPRLYQIQEHAVLQNSPSKTAEMSLAKGGYVWAYPALQKGWFMVLDSHGSLRYTLQENLSDFWK